jgi:hypothetical protein
VSGLLRGVAAAMAMSGVRSVTTALGLVRLTPPEEVGSHGAAPLLARVRPERRGAALELAHWSYGALGGAVFDALPTGARRSRLAGAAYGVGLWVFFETVVAPILGAPQRERPTSERATLIADHVLYGLLLPAGHSDRAGGDR